MGYTARQIFYVIFIFSLVASMVVTKNPAPAAYHQSCRFYVCPSSRRNLLYLFWADDVYLQVCNLFDKGLLADVPYLVILLSVAWRKLAGCIYCSLSLTKNMALFYLLFLLESFGLYGISLFSSFRGRVTERDSLTFGCLQFNSWRFGFSTGQSTKYQEKAVCLCVYYSTPCSMRHPLPSAL